MSAPGKQLQNGTYEFDYNRVPEAKTFWKAFSDYIYNPSEGTYCGHTGKKWDDENLEVETLSLEYWIIDLDDYFEKHTFLLCDFLALYEHTITGAFYAVFFSVLALLFAICMKGLLATINEEKPRWILQESLIGTNPGLGFRPISNNSDERSLIWYSSSDPASVQKWTGLLDKFLEEYVNSSVLPNGGRNQQICNYNTPVKPGHVCAVEVNNWGPCSPSQQYGFNNSAPCVFIKLNRIYGWEPEYYNDTKSLPSDMPASLVQHIKSINSSWLNTVWVSCKGDNPHDNENIGELKYYPEAQGFPGYYYPYKNIPGYLSPIIAVHFLRPARNRIINVECRAWAKNIIYKPSKKEKMGSVHFELMVDE